MTKVAIHNTKLVSVGVVDWNGRLRTKQIAASDLETVLRAGTTLTTAIFALDTAENPMSSGRFQDPAGGYPDGWLTIDAADVRSSESSVMAIGQFAPPFADYCPRSLASREILRLAALDITVLSAFEVECHILNETDETLRTKIPQQLVVRPEFARMYSAVDQAVASVLFLDLLSLASELGVGIKTSHAEFSGLLEAGLVPVAGLRSADDLIFYKFAVKTVAGRHRALATFMAKLSDHHESAGAHLNISLRSRTDDRPLFPGDGVSSEHQRHFIGGLQRYIPELFVLLAPNINSYKRFGAQSFVPRTNAWGVDNKTTAYRVVNRSPDLARIEVRVPGADINPYLVLAAVVAAGRRGVESRIEPTLAVVGNAWSPSAVCGASFPASLDEAVRCWRHSAFAAETFGEKFVAAFAESREWQLSQFSRAVTDWEVRQFAECV